MNAMDTCTTQTRQRSQSQRMYTLTPEDYNPQSKEGLVGDKSTIEWTDSTWNPLTGCSKVSPGCKNCYAVRPQLVCMLWENPRYQNEFEVTLPEDQSTLPLRWKQLRKIFVNSILLV